MVRGFVDNGMSRNVEMALTSWLAKVPTKLRFTRFRSNGFFLDEKNFQFEMVRERARVDRNGSSLAIVTIELPLDRAAVRDFDFLGRVLLRRLRITDTIGFLSNRVVGVLLPDTSKSGAWKVASDICGVYPVGHDRPNCEVIVYPDETPQRHEGASKHDHQPADRAAPISIDTLLARATPAWKRAIDVVGAVIGLIVSAPLLLLIAATIKLTSRGPILYVQEREGFAGRRFRILKLRTMRVGAEAHQAALQEYSEQDGPAFKMTRDPRTTWIGRWLRRTSLDELPQFWNVLRGEMSLVGPRPLWTCEATQCSPWQRQRLSVLPGLTCFWQVRARNIVTFDEWMRMDVQYARRRSLLCDLQLLVATPTAIVFGSGPR
jgi:lipopolysaccharide/colanic/teichoic acid biosynthesis glycosyltransferase